MSRIEITLKSGAIIEVDLDEWEWTKRLSGDATLTWKTPPDAMRRLVDVAIEDIAAIVEVRPIPAATPESR